MMCGIVDLGSNTIRLSIYHCEGPEFQLLLNKKTMIGLADYVHDGALSDNGILAACRVLASYRTLLDNFNVDEMYVFATASLRNISNTELAVETIRDTTGISVEVLDGETEAALSFLGAVSPGGVSDGLLADIGGGSIELVAYRNLTITSACSLPIGSLSLFSKYVDGLFPTLEERRSIRNRADMELELAKTAGLRCRHLVGVGGTIRGVSKLASNVFHKAPESHILTADEIRELYRLLKTGNKKTLRQILHAVPDRVHTIVPGLIILNTVVKSYGIETVAASSAGVREGYLLDRVLGR